MTPLLEIAELEGEIRSIEQRIEDLLIRKAALYSCLAEQESAVPGGSLQVSSSVGATVQPVLGDGPSPGPSSWATVVKKGHHKKRSKASIPLFDASLNITFPMSNSFDPLSKLHLESAPSPINSLARRVNPVQFAANGNSSTPASQSRSVARKRPASPALSTDSQSPPRSSLRGVDKRPRLSPHQLEGNNPSKSTSDTVSPPSPSTKSVSVPPALEPTTLETPKFAHLVPISSSSIIGKLRLSTYSYNNLDPEKAQFLLVGDSITRSIILPGVLTYTLSGGRTADFIELIPALFDIHPLVHTVIIHTGTNDVMSRESSRLYAELSSLAITVQSLGRRCVLSGPIPDMFNSSERFSRVLNLHTWMQNYCIATDVFFISNFDSFWSQSDLFKRDKLHPNTKGIATLTRNFISFIAFSLK